MGVAEMLKAKAAKLRAAKNSPKPAQAENTKKGETIKRSAKKSTSKKPTQNRKDTAALKEKVKKMSKSGKNLREISEELGISDSYAWVILKDYKYDPNKKRKAKK